MICIALAIGCVSPPVFVPRMAFAPTVLSYDEALARIATRQAADDSVAFKGGRTILQAHGHRTARVFVLLHGFTDWPTQFQPIGQQLFDAGDNVYIPRHPHHAERRATVRALGQMRAEELASFGDSTMEIARALGDSVVVVGLSMGGAVAAYLAQSRPDLTRAVLIAPALGAGRLNSEEERTLMILASKLPDIERTKQIDSTRPDYIQGVTSHGLAQVLRLGRLVRQQAEHQPPQSRNIVFLLNERDHTVSDQAALHLAQRWSDRGANVQVYEFPKSLGLPHNVMESTAYGGNVEVVYPVVIALALGQTPPHSVGRHAVPCTDWVCRTVQWLADH